MQSNAAVITKTGAQALINGQTYNVSKDNPNYRQVVDAIRSGNYAAIPGLIDLRTAVKNWMNGAFSGDFQLVGDTLRYKGYVFGEAVTSKALAMIDAGNDVKALVNFLAKVCLNDSVTAREELLLFCAANDFMISSNGNIVAYKAVRADYKDYHSGTKSYTIGAVVTEDRNTCDTNRHNTCSRGLHFAAYGYAKNFGRSSGHMMVIEVNPADVVAIPSDYNNEKGRAWKVTVVAELGTGHDSAAPLPKAEVYNGAAPAPVQTDVRPDKVTVASQNDYDLGYKHGFQHRARSEPQGVNANYDRGYKSGRSASGN